MDFYLPSKARIPTPSPLWCTTNDLLTTQYLWGSPHPWRLVHYSSTFWFLPSFPTLPSPAPLSILRWTVLSSASPALSLLPRLPRSLMLITPRLLHPYISISNNQLHISTWLVLPTSQSKLSKQNSLFIYPKPLWSCFLSSLKVPSRNHLQFLTHSLSHIPHSVALNQMFLPPLHFQPHYLWPMWPWAINPSNPPMSSSLK